MNPHARTKIWPFFAAMPVSILMAIALTPQIGGVVEYLSAYSFLIICATAYLIVGNQKNRKGYIHAAVALVFLSPILPILTVSIYETFNPPI
jgi:hypothetical protein